MIGVLTQWHESQPKSIRYYSQQLDLVTKGLPPCMTAIAAPANLLQHIKELIMGSPRTMCLIQWKSYLTLTVLSTSVPAD